MKLLSYYLLRFESPRKGAYLALEGDKGEHYLGEIAPLEGFSKESLDEALLQAEAYAKKWIQEQKRPDESKLFPSVSWAFSAALHDFPQENQKISLQRLLLPFEEIGRGYDCVKLKTQGLAIDKERLKALAKQGARIRVDANRSWSLEEARAYLAFCQDLPIDYIEEPVPRAYLEQVISESPFPIALDETLYLGEKIPPQAKVFVMKPSLLGGFSKLLPLFALAKKQACSISISSSFESAVGIAYLALLSAEFNPHMPVAIDTLRYANTESFPDTASARAYLAKRKKEILCEIL